MADSDESPSALRDRQTTGEDRVRMIARQLSEPRTVNWIASEADYSHEPTRRILERLADDGVLVRDDDGTHTTYYPDYRHQTVQEAMRLRDSVESIEALTDRLTEMKAQIREWEQEYSVDSPNELRATLAEADISADEEARRRERAQEWEHLQRRIRIVGFAIREWDFLQPPTEPGRIDN